MKLFTKAQWGELVRNGNTDGDHKPVVKLFVPGTGATWLISEVITEEDGGQDILFGLCDLGMGFPELGYVSLKELQELRVRPTVRMVDANNRVIKEGQTRVGIPVERDRFFKAQMTIGQYAEKARDEGRINA